MDEFRKLLQRHESTFERDQLLGLILRLKHTVIKFGLKKVNVSYSRISLSDIKSKLSLEGSIDEVEQIVAKAIRDGVIDAQIDHEQSFMRSQGSSDVYGTNEPQTMLDKRIKFCMNLHNEAQRALEFAQGDDKKDFGDVDEERSTKEEDLLASLLEDFGMDGDL